MKISKKQYILLILVLLILVLTTKEINLTKSVNNININLFKDKEASLLFLKENIMVGEEDDIVEEEISNKELGIDWDRYDQGYKILEEEREPERLKKLINNIAEHSELSPAEKELTISIIRYKDKFPLETLDGYSKYKKEFEDKHPEGYDPSSNYTFEDYLNYFSSLADRVKADL